VNSPTLLISTTDFVQGAADAAEFRARLAHALPK
jgi:hypothetical protein